MGNSFSEIKWTNLNIELSSIAPAATYPNWNMNVQGEVDLSSSQLQESSLLLPVKSIIISSPRHIFGRINLTLAETCPSVEYFDKNTLLLRNLFPSLIINERKTVDSSHLKEFLSDVFSPSAMELKKWISLSIRSNSSILVELSQGKLGQVEAVLASFDGYYKAEAVAPVLLESVRVLLMHRLWTEMGDIADILLGADRLTEYDILSCN